MQLPGDQRQQRKRDDGVEAEQPRIVAGEERRVGTRRGKQKEQDAAKGGGGNDQAFHLLSGTTADDGTVAAAAGTTDSAGLKIQRAQSDDRFQSRLASALTWKVFGIWLKSRRMRTAAW